jgi:PTH1 family peptidyl-tRNA hydrolase
MAVDHLADRHNLALTQQKFHGRYATGFCGAQKVCLLEPETFMNLSGKSVVAAANFYDVEPGAIIVVHDELDIDLGKARVKSGGGHGGHNGLRDIVAKMGTKDFVRIRLGIGRPERGDVTSHVLAPFRADEMPAVEEMVETACDAIEYVLEHGAAAAQNEFNGR